MSKNKKIIILIVTIFILSMLIWNSVSAELNKINKGMIYTLGEIYYHRNENNVFDREEDLLNLDEFYYDQYSNGDAEFMGYSVGLKHRNDVNISTYEVLKRFDSSIFMNKETLEAARNRLGRLAIYKGNDYDENTRPRYYYGTDHTIPKSTAKYTVNVHPNILCLESYTTGDYTENLKLMNIIDINNSSDEKTNPLDIQLYYYDRNTQSVAENPAELQESEKEKYGTNAAKLAYYCYFAGEAENTPGYVKTVTDRFGTRTDYGRSTAIYIWQQTFRKDYLLYTDLLNKSSFKDKVYKFNYWNLHNNGNAIDDSYTQPYFDAEAYADFAKQIDNNNGSIEASNNEIEKENNIIKGIMFDNIITDKYEYGKKSRSFNYQEIDEDKTLDLGTQNKISVSAVLNDGTEITEGVKVIYAGDKSYNVTFNYNTYIGTYNNLRSREERVVTINTGDVITDLKCLEEGYLYNVEIPEEYQESVVSIKFTSEYYLYSGRMMMCYYDVSSSEQCRIVVGGDRTLIKEEAVFELPYEDIEILELIKKDAETGEVLTGAKFNINVSGNGIDKTVRKITDDQGKITINSREIGLINPTTFTGKLRLLIRETEAPEGYIKWTDRKAIDVTYENGVIVSVKEANSTESTQGENAIEVSYSNSLVTIAAYDTPTNIPTIIIKKTDIEGASLKGAEFTAVIEANGNNVTLSGLTSNDAGEIIIYYGDLSELGIDAIDKWSGTLKVTLRETKAPDGYKDIPGDVIINITFQDGEQVSAESLTEDVECRIDKIFYKDEKGNENYTNGTVIKVKNELDSRLRIRKIDGDSDVQRALGGATFSIKISADPKVKNVARFSKTSGEDGYIDITDEANELVGSLGSYTGRIAVKMNETENPSGYMLLPELYIDLIYNNGKLVEARYNDGDDISKSTIDVSDSKADVTLAIKNTKTLEYINLAKIDSVSGLGIPNVEFRVKMISDNVEHHEAEFTELTSADGLIILDKEKLKKVGITERYTGKLYLVIEEITTPDGYKPLSEKVNITVEYEDGVIKDVTKTSGTANLVNATLNGIKTLKVEIPNERELPDIIIKKQSLNNGELGNISATFTIKVTVPEKPVQITKTGVTVDNNSEIKIEGSELEVLGIDGTYTGNILVELQETAVSDEAARITDTITVTLELKDGRLVSSSSSNEAHTSIEDKSAKIEIKVLNFAEPTPVIIEGKVWEELSGTKAHDIEIDGLYDPDGSATERKDTLLKDIEVTLYKMKDNNLTFVTLSKGTNPTYTDENGEYRFELIKEEVLRDKEAGYTYVVKFTYNGLKYQNTINNTDAINGSDARELATEITGINNDERRDETTLLFSEIGSYPAQYKYNTNKKLFKYSHYDVTEEAYAAGYNVAYRYDELQDIYKNIAIEMKYYLRNLGNIDFTTSSGFNTLKAIYRNVVEKYYKDESGNLTDSEIYNKLQFIYDSRVSAFAGKANDSFGTGAGNELGKCLLTDVSRLGSYSGADASDEVTIAVDDENININLGLVRRDMTDLSLLNDVYKVITSVNGHNGIYSFDKGESSYTHYLYEEDYNYGTTPNSNGNAWYQDENIDLYVTYKTTVTNSTNTVTKLTEVVDYYDNRFEFAGVTAKKFLAETDNTGTNIDNITANTEGKYPSSSRIGLQGSTGYNEIYITFANGSEPSLVDGERLEIYITLKLGNETNTAKQLLNEFINDSSNLTEYNYAEINGYKTNDGYLDVDSKPGTFIIKEFENARQEYLEALTNRSTDKARYVKALEDLIKVREDDAWRVDLELSKGSNDHHRTLSGNVWEAASEDNNELVLYMNDNGIEGILVELVELIDGNQIVRARAMTDENGSYTFRNYIPGEYTVRFIYGSENREGYTAEQLAVSNETSKTYNGPNFQSAKANPDTDINKYWYSDTETRYSDAYDDVKLRVSIETNGEEVEEKDFTFQDVLDYMNSEVGKTMYAYTSTLVIEMENAKTNVDGQNEYSYNINNVDFAITQKSSADIDFEKYVSNIKIYLQDGTLQLNANIDKDGIVTYINDPKYTNIVLVHKSTLTYLDGLVETLFDEELLNGATLEITYDIVVTNNSDANAITYIYSEERGNTPVAVAYYGESYDKLPSYESDREDGRIVYHNGTEENYSLEKYARTEQSSKDAYVTEVVDYIDPNLTFIQVNKAGEEVNRDWEIIDASTIITSRNSNQELINKYNTVVKASSTNNLYSRPSVGNSAHSSITLSKVLSTSSTETNDWEFSNLAEITKIHSDSIRNIKLEGYDITGTEAPETSRSVKISDIKGNIYPTLGTAKSETVVLHAPTGLNSIERILSNTVIVLIALVILAGGIVLIKKFVITKNNN